VPARRAAGIRKLARLLGRAEKPLNPSNGPETPRVAALIDESRCIGCLLCIKACPVDAIVGAAKHMHTVLTESCTGLRIVPSALSGGLHRSGRTGCAGAARQSSCRVAGDASAGDMAVLARERFGFHAFRVAREQENAINGWQRKRTTGSRTRGVPAFTMPAARKPPCRPRSSVPARAERCATSMNAEKRAEIFRRLRNADPHPTTELAYQTPFELLISVILSAQATDKSVNLATARLFRWPIRRRKSSRSVNPD